MLRKFFPTLFIVCLAVTFVTKVVTPVVAQMSKVNTHKTESR